MGNLLLCTAAALNIFSMPAGNTVVGQVPAYKAVYLMDGSLMRDWVFIGKPGPDGVSPRGWVKYEYLGTCPKQQVETLTETPRDLGTRYGCYTDNAPKWCEEHCDAEGCSR